MNVESFNQCLFSLQIKKNEAATEKERIRECTNKHEEKPSKDLNKHEEKPSKDLNKHEEKPSTDLNKHGEKPFKDTIKQGEKPFESFDVDVENLEENKSLKNLDEGFSQIIFLYFNILKKDENDVLFVLKQ